MALLQPPIPQEKIQEIHKWREWFTTLRNNISRLIYTPSGYFGSFWDTTTQSAASTTTAYSITINTADTSNKGCTVASGSRITVSTAGVYNIQYSVQLVNSGANTADVDIWLRKNDSGSTGDIVASNSIYSVPAKHAGTDGHAIAAVNYVLSLAANDFIELVWHTNDTSVTIQTVAAGVTPTRPSTPGVIVTITQVAVL